MQGCKTSDVTGPYTGTVMCYYGPKMSEKHKNKQTKINNSKALSWSVFRAIKLGVTSEIL